MGLLAYGLTVHSLVTSAGAYAGLAAIVGLAILVLLHFAQARESAGLREQAYEAARRVEELEARLAQFAHQQAAQAAPRPARAVPQAARAGAPPAQAAAQPAPARAAAAFRGAPAGVAAPALTAATRLIPVAVPTEGTPAGNGPAGSAGRITKTHAPVAAAAPAPVGVSAGANGGSHGRVAPHPVAARVGPGVGGGAGVGTPPRPPARPGGESPRPSARPAEGPPRFLPPEPDRAGRFRTGRVIAALVGGLLAVAAIAVALIATSTIGGTSTSGASHRTAAAGSARSHGSAGFNPGSVTVAVLNGTATPGLAGRTSKRLSAAGYKPGMVATASDQTRATTVVAYLPGYRADALHVAMSLKLPVTAVEPVNSSAQAVACPPPTACSANVVVTVGANLASS